MRVYSLNLSTEVLGLLSFSFNAFGRRTHRGTFSLHHIWCIQNQALKTAVFTQSHTNIYMYKVMDPNVGKACIVPDRSRKLWKNLNGS